MMHIKTVKVTNPNNVLVQVPGFIAKKWGLEKGDSVEVHISDDERQIVIKPRKGYVTIRLGSGSNEES